MPNFFPMPSGDRWFLLTIIVFSIISFLPWMQEIEISGMALFGWMMAALMILSPTIALIRLIRRHVTSGGEKK
jgi:hypothetical protein